MAGGMGTLARNDQARGKGSLLFVAERMLLVPGGKWRRTATDALIAEQFVSKL